MYIVREVLNCKPGQVRPMVENFQAISRVAQELGHEPLRIMTDVSGEPFWTVVVEIAVETVEHFFALEKSVGAHESIRHRLGSYHDLIQGGRREIYRIEA
jgi:hypothetical protein